MLIIGIWRTHSPANNENEQRHANEHECAETCGAFRYITKCMARATGARISHFIVQFISKMKHRMYWECNAGCMAVAAWIVGTKKNETCTHISNLFGGSSIRKDRKRYSYRFLRNHLADTCVHRRGRTPGRGTHSFRCFTICARSATRLPHTLTMKNLIQLMNVMWKAHFVVHRRRENEKKRERENDGYSVDRRIHAVILCQSRNSMSDGLAANAWHIPSVKWFAIETKNGPHTRAAWRSKETDDDDEKYFEKLWTAKNVGVAYTPLQKNRNKLSLFIAQIRRHFVSF